MMKNVFAFFFSKKKSKFGNKTTAPFKGLVRDVNKSVFFLQKKTLFRFSDIIDSDQIQDPRCFLRHLEYIPIDFRGPGAFRSASAPIYRRKT